MDLMENSTESEWKTDEMATSSSRPSLSINLLTRVRLT